MFDEEKRRVHESNNLEANGKELEGNHLEEEFEIDGVQELDDGPIEFERRGVEDAFENNEEFEFEENEIEIKHLFDIKEESDGLDFRGFDGWSPSESYEYKYNFEKNENNENNDEKDKELEEKSFEKFEHGKEDDNEDNEKND